ncbi:MAG: hypothetical protein LBU32_14625 [Clostridiales bacterium]|nr:hypothetical protein [Clostridiales bacterium]
MKRASAIAKYEQTYLSSIQELATFGSNREAYEKRVGEIMTLLCCAQVRASATTLLLFRFSIHGNSLVYNLILGSSNIEGIKLFKKTAWKTFGGKSSEKDTHGNENQIMFDITNEGAYTTQTDEYCYCVKDIAKYLFSLFEGKSDVPLTDVWAVLDEHPVFPSEGYANDIKKELKNDYNCTVSRSSITFPNRR